MITITKPKPRVALIVRTHVESTSGALRVVRLEPSKEGTKLLTAKSSGIPSETRDPLSHVPFSGLRRRATEAA
jgi:hypothetical protein